MGSSVTILIGDSQKKRKTVQNCTYLIKNKKTNTRSFGNIRIKEAQKLPT
jgi:hypothetical protein